MATGIPTPASSRRVRAWSPRVEEHLNRSRAEPLHPGDCVRFVDGSVHFIQYVNTSGAYAVPLAGITREIAGNTVTFNAGGKTISISSLVEKINPLSLGGNSQEYRRCVRMLEALKEGGMAKRKVNLGEGAQGTTFDDFDTSELEMSDAAKGHLDAADLETPNDSEAEMAKKAKKAAKPARAAKAPKTVRNCACGCGTETTGHFAPGHDARVHGWIAKLADGRIEPKDTNASWRAKAGLVKTANGFKVTKPKFYLD